MCNRILRPEFGTNDGAKCPNSQPVLHAAPGYLTHVRLQNSKRSVAVCRGLSEKSHSDQVLAVKRLTCTALCTFQLAREYWNCKEDGIQSVGPPEPIHIAQRFVSDDLAWDRTACVEIEENVVEVYPSYGVCSFTKTNRERNQSACGAFRRRRYQREPDLSTT